MVKIQEAPFDTNKNEVWSFVGVHSGVVEHFDTSCLVHITMDKMTSKTGDIFVEFTTDTQAQAVIKKIHSGGRKAHNILGKRQVKATMSTQGELMRAIFPRAACSWRPDGTPVFNKTRQNGESAFASFVHPEEIHFLKAYMRDPTKARFCSSHPQRIFDSLLSTVQKYPQGFAEKDGAKEEWRDCVNKGKEYGKMLMETKKYLHVQHRINDAVFPLNYHDY